MSYLSYLEMSYLAPSCHTIKETSKNFFVFTFPPMAHILMSQKETLRLPILQNLINGLINGTEAAKQCGLSSRQIRRIKHRFIKKKLGGITHRLRGATGNRRIPETVMQITEQIVRERYHDFGPTFAAEKLREEHAIVMSDETLRARMTEWGLWKPRPRKTNGQYHSWRARKEHYGEMIQFDGSYHAWFEERARGLCCLLGAIDDATGNITQLEFAEHEGIEPVFTFWKTYMENQGKPVSIYLDRYSTYKQNARKNILDNPRSLTQFERAMGKLEIKVIHAYSPQAKGRIERLFGTLQDRLVKELRLAGISEVAMANQFLREKFIPDFNKKFAVPATNPVDVHRHLMPEETGNLSRIFAQHETRIVLNDFTVRFQNQWLQLEEKQPTLVRRKDTVEVETRLDGSLHLYLRGKELFYTSLPERPQRLEIGKVVALVQRPSAWKPAANHPWRKSLPLQSKVDSYTG